MQNSYLCTHTYSLSIYIYKRLIFTAQNTPLPRGAKSFSLQPHHSTDATPPAVAVVVVAPPPALAVTDTAPPTALTPLALVVTDTAPPLALELHEC